MTAPRICHVCGSSNPPHARYCNQCGTFLDLAPTAMPAAEERRWVTILFADLVNSTALLEHMDPEDARELISGCLDRLAHEIVAVGGTVDKFIGDAVMAIFGAPVAHEDDAARALRAAFQMQASLARHNAEQLLKLDLRIGVNTGQVVVGTRYVGGRDEYTATGDAVNVAARLQQTAQPGQIVAGEVTVRQAGLGFSVRPLASLKLRGKQEPVNAFLVESQADSAAVRSSTGTPLVNRRAELARLSRDFEQLSRGRGRIILLSGEPGIGKSRLITEARRLSPPDVRWLDGRARSYGPGLNYHVFRSVTQQLFGLTEESGGQAASDQLRELLRELGTPRAFSHLARLTSLPDDGPEIESMAHLSPDQAELRVIQDLSAMVEAVNRQQPGVLALDDLHWADSASLALLNAFLPLVTRVPLVLLLSFRDEPDAPISAIRDRAWTELRRWTTKLELKPLSANQTGQLLDQILGKRPGLARLRNAIQEKADGNPLFVEEIVRSLTEQGTLTNLADLTLTASAVRLPLSIQGIILSRVDRLPDVTRRALQVAAVIGREFDVSLLSAVDPEITPDGLELALQAEIISIAGSEESQHYAFHHTLSREAIYRTLLLRRRRALHARIAEAIASSLDAPEDEAALLAYHYRQAQRWADVAKYAMLAGDQASRTFASRDAVNHYTHALEALSRLGETEDSVRRAAVLRARGRAYERTGKWQDAQADFEAALEASPDNAIRESVLLSLARLHTDHDDYASALRWTSQALELARINGDRRGYARALSMEARVLVRQSRAQQAVGRLTEALAVQRELGDRRGEAEALDNMAAPLSLLGDVEGAYVCQLQALGIYAELGDREREADVRSVLAEWMWYRGDFRGAVEAARAARAVHEELGVLRYQAHDRLVEGMALATLGNFHEALAALDAAVRQAEQMDHPEWVAHALVPMGIVFRALRRLGRARRAFERASMLGEQIGARHWAQLGRLGLGFTAFHDGNLALAESSFREVMSAPEGLQFARARAMTGLAMVELDRGNVQLADDWVRWSIAITEAAPYVEALLEAQILQGRLFLLSDRTEEASELLRKVHSRARDLGARPLQAQARRAMSLIEVRAEKPLTSEC